MKQILFTLLLFCTVGLLSCRKNNNDIDIKQYDDQQIKAYIAANGLTGMTRDLSSGDTTGIYYQILAPGSGLPITYASTISLAFTVKSFDGQFNAADTLTNHVYNYLGHLSANNLPSGVELALLNILKYKGGRIRVLIPSRLAYGKSGFGSGSSTSGNRVAGNQCLDYYINLIGDQNVYDDQSVAKYISRNNLTGYTQVLSGDYKGLYYKINQQGSGNAISNQSLVTVQYTGLLLNGSQTSDQVNYDGGVTLDMATDPRKGLVGGIIQALPGAKISLIMPSRLAYGGTAYGDASIPIYSCLRYEVNVISVQ